jgi:hypothetical protein
MKNSKKRVQIRQVLDELKKEPATSMMLSVQTGILRANLTRYLAKLERQHKIVVTTEKPCKITGHKAKYYSAKPAHLPKEITGDFFPVKAWGV